MNSQILVDTLVNEKPTTSVSAQSIVNHGSDRSEFYCGRMKKPSVRVEKRREKKKRKDLRSDDELRQILERIYKDTGHIRFDKDDLIEEKLRMLDDIPDAEKQRIIVTMKKRFPEAHIFSDEEQLISSTLSEKFLEFNLQKLIEMRNKSTNSAKNVKEEIMLLRKQRMEELEKLKKLPPLKYPPIQAEIYKKQVNLNQLCLIL